MSVAYVGGGSFFTSTSITTPMMNYPTTFTNSVLNGNAGPITRMMAISTRYRYCATEPTKAPHADEQQLLHRMGRTPIGRASGHPEQPQGICCSPKAAAASARSLSVDSSAPVAVLSLTLRMRAAVGVSACTRDAGLVVTPVRNPAIWIHGSKERRRNHLFRRCTADRAYLRCGRFPHLSKLAKITAGYATVIIKWHG
jgi:hypothetical protein